MCKLQPPGYEADFNSEILCVRTDQASRGAVLMESWPMGVVAGAAVLQPEVPKTLP